MFLVLSSITNYTFNQLNSAPPIHSRYPSTSPTLSPLSQTLAPSLSPSIATDDQKLPVPGVDTDGTRFGITLVVIELIFIIFFALRWLVTRLPRILKTLRRYDSHLLRYTGISDFSIWIETAWLAWFTLIIYGDVVRLKHREETDRSSFAIAVATMLQYMLFILYFRPFSMFGPLIGMIQAIVWDIKYYILILTVVTYGFSQAIYLSSWSDPVNAFDTPGSSMAQSIVYLVGNPAFPPNSYSYESANAQVGTFLAIMLTVVGSIIMLNLLIAIMNSAYTRIYQRSEAEWVKQICITITEQSPLKFLQFRPESDKFIHFLRRRVDVDHEKKLATSEQRPQKLLTEIEELRKESKTYFSVDLEKKLDAALKTF